MRNSTAFAAALLAAGAAAPALAANGEAEASVTQCLETAAHKSDRPSTLTQSVRERLVGDPGQLDRTVKAAGAAVEPKRAEIVSGIVRAAEYLRCVDPTGLQAVANYLNSHGDNEVVAEVNQALGPQKPNPGAAGDSKAGGSAVGFAGAGVAAYGQ